MNLAGVTRCRNTGPGDGLAAGAPGEEEQRPFRNGCSGSLALTAWTACRNSGPCDGFRAGAPGLKPARSEAFWALAGIRARHGWDA
jgi:hypothetical protein